jgi:hypothetical protein
MTGFSAPTSAGPVWRMNILVVADHAEGRTDQLEPLIAALEQAQEKIRLLLLLACTAGAWRTAYEHRLKGAERPAGRPAAGTMSGIALAVHMHALAVLLQAAEPAPVGPGQGCAPFPTMTPTTSDRIVLPAVSSPR